MLSIQFIREHADIVRKSLSDRQTADGDAIVERILELDRQRRDMSSSWTACARSRTPPANASVRRRTPPSASGIIDDMKSVSRGITSSHQRSARSRTNSNMREGATEHPDGMPTFPDAARTRTRSSSSMARSTATRGASHTGSWASLGIIDFERGVKLVGKQRFYVLKGAGLQRALIAFMLELHIDRHGYTGNPSARDWRRKKDMWRSGNSPKFADKLYHDAEEDFWFVPTAEVPLTNLHGDEMIDAGVLPLPTSHTHACFRARRCSAGRDVRGIKRGHQFDKVEMYKFVDRGIG